MFSTAWWLSWLFEETRKALREKLVKVTGKGKKDVGRGSASLKRSFEGKLLVQLNKKEESKDSAQSLLEHFNKRCAIVKLVARTGNDQSTSRRSSTVQQNRSGNNEDAMSLHPTCSAECWKMRDYPVVVWIHQIP